MERGYTRNACPGCKQGCRYNPRPVDGVCSECAAILKRVRDGRAEKEQRKGGLKPYRVPRASHCMAYIPHDAFTPTIQPALFALTLAVSVADQAGLSEYDNSISAILGAPISGYRQGTVGGVRLFHPHVAETLDALLAAIGEGMVHAYTEGKDRGTSLLMSLQSGELAPSDFDKRKLT